MVFKRIRRQEIGVKTRQKRKQLMNTGAVARKKQLKTKQESRLHVEATPPGRPRQAFGGGFFPGEVGRRQS